MYWELFLFLRRFTLHSSKTHSGAKKRFKITASGKVVRFRAYRSHILAKMTRKRKRQLHGSTLVDKSDMNRICRMLVI